MCTVSVKIDEALLRDMMPELDSIAAIRLWVQNLVDLHVQELVAEEEATMDLETAREMLLAAVREEYTKDVEGYRRV